MKDIIIVGGTIRLNNILLNVRTMLSMEAFKKGSNFCARLLLISLMQKVKKKLSSQGSPVTEARQ